MTDSRRWRLIQDRTHGPACLREGRCEARMRWLDHKSLTGLSLLVGRRPRGQRRERLQDHMRLEHEGYSHTDTGERLWTQASGGAGAFVHARELAHDSWSVLCNSGTAGMGVHGQAYVCKTYMSARLFDDKSLAGRSVASSASERPRDCWTA